jgi:hypothetical protein
LLVGIWHRHAGELFQGFFAALSIERCAVRHEHEGRSVFEVGKGIS